MMMRPKSMVGLDLGANAVKAIELTQRGKEFTITGFGQVEVPSDDREARVQAIKDLMREGGFRTRRVVTSVSGKSVIVRYLSMVRMSDEELRNAIVFEAEKYIPFPLDESVVDCQRLELPSDVRGGTEGQMPVLLVAVKRSFVDDHLRLLEAAGITPEIVDVDAFALGNALGLGGSGDDDRTSALVDVGASKASINVMRNGTSLFTREIGVGGNSLTEAIVKRIGVSFEEAEGLKREPGDGVDLINDAAFPVIDDLGNEIQLSFDYFENQYERQIETIQLSGGAAQLGCFREAMERIFERPTSVFNPFERLSVDPSIDADLLTANSPQLVVAVGLASRLRRN